MGVRMVTGALFVGLALLTAPAAVADSGDSGAPSAPGEAAAQTATQATTQTGAPPDGVPHLPSPGSLPPGTTQDAPQPRTLGYLRDIFHAVRNQDVTVGDALLLIAQRPMDYPGALQATSPQPDPVPAPDAPPAESPAPGGADVP